MWASGSWAGGAVPALVNAGFEAETQGGLPLGWQMRALAQSHGYKATLKRENPHTGQSCLEISQPAPTPFDHLGLVTQIVSAESLRGKRIRFRAAVRMEVEGVGPNYVALWARAIRPGGKPCPFVDMADHPVRAT